MKKWLFAVLFGSALVLGACGGGDDGASDDTSGDTGTEEDAGSEEGGTVDTAAAEEVFESNCASCHGADLSGGAGPDLTQVGSSMSADEIATIIEEGKGSMPPGLVSGGDVDLLANWLAEQK
ncbi:cytochrome C551 [Virgibacillus profundi]|uniref:Cytochrome C551 n=1 Tax=Virgibacillus profundi TaxID=2024555 RepID=A0A2A2II95_9BACI|nr:cytochrome c [Virgibacillus profundi]PAV31026.1 cytochrome C551 [Virgibacillus profundi]PXY55212.1 cytochrome c [Virgibacillus profundi]